MKTSKITKSLKKIGKLLQHNSSKILIGFGILGFGATVIVASEVTPLAIEKLEESHQLREENEKSMTVPEKIFDDVKTVAPIYGPVVGMFAVSTACIIGANHISNKRTAALATAYQISRSKLKDFEKKFLEELGEVKYNKAKNEIVQKDMPTHTNADMNEIDDGKTLCYDAQFRRYFRASIEDIRKAETRLNKRLLIEMWVSLNELYGEIGVSGFGSIGDDLGWNVDEEIDIRLSSMLTPDDKQCVVIDYAIVPRYDFRSML